MARKLTDLLHWHNGAKNICDWQSPGLNGVDLTEQQLKEKS
jgi:hypothetical protein